MVKKTNIEKLILAYILSIFMPLIISSTMFDYHAPKYIDNMFILFQISIMILTSYIILNNKSKLNQKINIDDRIIKLSAYYFIYSVITMIIRLTFFDSNRVLELKNIINIVVSQLSLVFYNIVLIYFNNLNLKNKYKEDLFKILIIISCFTIFYNFIFKFEEFNKFSRPNVTSTLNFRSIFSNRNYFGFYMFTSIVLIINQFKQKKKYKLFILILHVISIVISMSRNSLLALLVFIFSILLIKLYRNRNLLKLNTKRNKYIAISILILLLINSEYILNYLRLEDLFSERIIIWSLSFKVFKINPVIGVNEFSSRVMLSELFGRAVQPHNTLISYLISFGIIGTIILIIELFYFSKNVYKSSLNKNYIMSFFASLFIYSFFENLNLIGYNFFASIVFLTLLIL